MTDEIVKYIDRLTSFLDTSFPDFRKFFTDLQVKTGLTILTEYLKVTAILDPKLDKAKIINQIKTISHKIESYTIKKYTKLYQAARNSS